MAASLISTCTSSLHNMSLVELTDNSCVVLLYVELHTVSINSLMPSLLLYVQVYKTKYKEPYFIFIVTFQL